MGGYTMSNIKIIFFDIDGTLIDMKKKQISKKVLETLMELRFVLLLEDHQCKYHIFQMLSLMLFNL